MGDWVDNKIGRMHDEFKFTLVNFNNLLYKNNQIGDEPFILAEQVCYVKDPLNIDWHFVLKMTVRDLFDMYTKDSSCRPSIVPQVELYAEQQLDESLYVRDKDIGWVRQGVNGTIVDANVIDDDDNDDNDENDVMKNVE